MLNSSRAVPNNNVLGSAVVTVVVIGVASSKNHGQGNHCCNESQGAKNVDKDVPDERGPAQVPCAFIVSICVRFLGL